jgi:two-component sensor histidine kinase
MESKTIDLLKEINAISKIHTLQRDDIDAIMREFGQRILATFRIERMSVWLLNSSKDQLVSMGEYDLRDQSFKKNNILHKQKFPSYFQAIENNEILLVENMLFDSATSELLEDYTKPNNVLSLMDIPLRIEGELIGVMCFEKTGEIERIFTSNEQTFAMSIAIVFASTLEARQRRAIQHQLKEELKEKEILIKEIHHRVKNNLSVVSSLMSLQANKSKDEFHRSLFNESRNKINAISDLHSNVYQRESISSLSMFDYLSELINNLREFYSNTNENIQIIADIDQISIPMNKALPLALIINELVTNSFKHAFKKTSKGNIKVKMKSFGNDLKLTVTDNGSGFETDVKASTSLGLEIIKDLVDQLNGIGMFKKSDGMHFEMSFPINS